MRELSQNLLNKPLAIQAETIEGIANSGEKYAVFGVDIYQYSKMPPGGLVALPAILDKLIYTSSQICVKYAPKLFLPSQDSVSPFSRYVSTGDGFFMIFENPVQASIFATQFASVVRFINGGLFRDSIYSGTGELFARYCVTYGHVYKYGSNYFGRAIIDCARILSRDKLDRFLIDKHTHEWFLSQIYGIENLKNLSPAFSKSNLIGKIMDLGIEPQEYSLFAQIKNCIELKLEKTIAKASEFDVYAVFIELYLTQGEDKS